MSCFPLPPMEPSERYLLALEKSIQLVIQICQRICPKRTCFLIEPFVVQAVCTAPFPDVETAISVKVQTKVTLRLASADPAVTVNVVDCLLAGPQHSLNNCLGLPSLGIAYESLLSFFARANFRHDLMAMPTLSIIGVDSFPTSSGIKGKLGSRTSLF
jgi:hypothetical protein